MTRSDSIKNIAKALAQFQAKVSNPKSTATNPKFGKKYAPLDEIIKAIKPALGECGLSYFQSTSTDGENVVVETILMHESGEWIESTPLKLPAYQIRSGGVKEFNAQGAGAAITYGRRYSLSAILGIASEEDDDAQALVDGQGPSNSSPAQSSSQQQQPSGQGGQQQQSGPAAMISSKQIGAIKGKVKKVAELTDKPVEEVEQTLKEKCQYESTNALTSAQASKVLDQLEAWIRSYSQRQSG